MNTDQNKDLADDSRINAITEKIIGCAFRVANTLGIGFLEKVYENALAYELRKLDFHVEQQWPITVYYDGIEVGFYEADLFVEDLVPVEVKHVKAFDDAHLAQTLNYLRATNRRIALLINFGKSKIEIKRVVHG
ncbi:MAG: GxxExxY protein [Pirellulales bacterium]